MTSCREALLVKRISFLISRASRFTKDEQRVLSRIGC